MLDFGATILLDPPTRMIPQGGLSKVPINEKFLSNSAVPLPPSFLRRSSSGNQSGFPDLHRPRRSVTLRLIRSRPPNPNPNPIGIFTRISNLRSNFRIRGIFRGTTRAAASVYLANKVTEAPRRQPILIGCYRRTNCLRDVLQVGEK